MLYSVKNLDFASPVSDILRAYDQRSLSLMYVTFCICTYRARDSQAIDEILMQIY